MSQLHPSGRHYTNNNTILLNLHLDTYIGVILFVFLSISYIYFS